MRFLSAGLAGVVLLAGCASEVPSGTSTDYSQYELDRARREAALTGAAAPSGVVPPSAGAVWPTATAPAAALPAGNAQVPYPAPGATAPATVSSADLAAAGIGTAPVATTPIASGTEPYGSTALPGSEPLQRQGVEATPVNNGSGLSQNDFETISSRESIESDAQRQAALASQYSVVQPTALPTRDGGEGPNIVDYALSAPNRRGQEWYSRSVVRLPGQFERNCAAYNSPDAAQRDFLARGGPERDPRGIDPDGDGFACGWDPAPFVAAAGRG